MLQCMDTGRRGSRVELVPKCKAFKDYLVSVPFSTEYKELTEAIQL